MKNEIRCAAQNPVRPSAVLFPDKGGREGRVIILNRHNTDISGGVAPPYCPIGCIFLSLVVSPTYLVFLSISSPPLTVLSLDPQSGGVDQGRSQYLLGHDVCFTEPVGRAHTTQSFPRTWSWSQTYQYFPIFIN